MDTEPVSGPEPAALAPADGSPDWAAAWDVRQMESLLEWQFGVEGASLVRSVAAERSRRTGRLTAARGPEGRWFIFGPGGVARPTWRGAQELHRALPYPRGRIVVDADATPFVARGKSLFSRFVRGGDSSLAPEGPALLVDPEDRLLAVGRLLLAPYEMGRLTRGVAVRVTAHARDLGEMVVESESTDPTIGYG